MGKKRKYAAGRKRVKKAEIEEDRELTTGKVKKIIGVKKKLVKMKILELRKAKYTLIANNRKGLNKRMLEGQKKAKEIKEEIKKMKAEHEKECEQLFSSVANKMEDN